MFTSRCGLQQDQQQRWKQEYPGNTLSLHIFLLPIGPSNHEFPEIMTQKGREHVKVAN
jgi:hypothetical protein